MNETAEPSASSGWLSSSRKFADTDPGRRKRLWIAFAAAVAVHEVLAGFWWGRWSAPTPEPSAEAQLVTITKRTPPPTPKPTPVPTPKPTPHVVRTFAPVPTHAEAAPKAAAPVTHHVGGRAAARVRHVIPPHVRHATPKRVALAPSTGAGVNNGGAGTGAGAGTGTGGLGGTGSGTSGTGTGTAGGVAPCGIVIFKPVPGQVRINRDGSRTMSIEVEVRLSDGSTITDTLGWPWYYRNESVDPFSPRNNDDHIPTTFQFPPAGYDVAARQSAATLYVIKHTRADGFTDLLDCPGD